MSPDPVAPVDPNATLVHNLTSALNAAPELAQNPGLAVPVAQAGGDVAGNAQGVAAVSNANSLHQAVKHVSQSTGGGFFGSLFHTVSHAAGDVVSGITKGASYVGKLANAPLNYVQHEYRYIHDVEARHGIWAGIGEAAVALGGAAAAVGGVAAAPFTGGASLAITAGVLGAETAVGVESQLKYRDSWQATANGNSYVDPHTHQPVSIGRDFASSVLGEKPGTGTYKFMSGLGDAIGDLGLDPLQRAGTATAGIRAARETITSGDQIVKAVATNARIARAVDTMASSDAVTISRLFPKFAPLSKELAAASTRDEVTQVLRNAFETPELMLHGNRLPALSLTAIPVEKVKMAIADTKLARGQQLLPSVLDPNLKLTNKEFDPMDPASGLQVYRWLRGSGQTESVARTVANNFINSDDLQQKIEIYRNAVFSSVKAMAVARKVHGLPTTEAERLVMDDPEVQRRLYGASQTITGGMYPGREGIYAHGPPGAVDIPGVTTSEGNTVSAAVLDSQQGKLSFPSPQDMRQAAAMLAGAKGLYGKADDFAYKYVTQNIFKRAVLASFSFPMHVAGSEVLLNSLRKGALNLLKSRVAVTAGKLADKYGGDEMVQEMMSDPNWHEALGRYLYNMIPAKYMGDGTRAADMVDLAGLTQTTGITPEAVQSMHGGSYIEDSVADVQRTALHDAKNKKIRGVDKHGSYAPGQLDPGSSDPLGGQTRAWQQWLDQITKDPGSAVAANAYKAALDRGETEVEAHRLGVEQATLWLQDHPELHPNLLRANAVPQEWAGMDPLQAFAEAKMLNVRGATTGLDGTIHHDLLQAITDGHFRPRDGQPRLPDSITREKLRDIPQKPTKTPGRLYEPVMTSPLVLASDKLYSAIGSIINFIAREPIFGETFHQQMNLLRPMVADGRITHEDAVTKAADWAVQDMIPFVHNIHEKTQFSESMRNYAPFFFAQQQAYKRVGRLLAENPGAFRKYQLMITGIQNIGHNSTDASGQNNFVIPGAGFLGAGVPAIMDMVGMPMANSSPVSFAGSLNSLSFVLPGATGVSGLRPEFGPFVSVPVKAIASMFPELTPAATSIVGPITMNAAMWQQFVPNAFINRVQEALAGDSRGFQSTVMSTIQSLDYEQNVAEKAWIAGGRKGPEPDIVPTAAQALNPIVRQNFINKVKNQTRILYLVRAGLGFFSPLSPQIQVNDFGFGAKVNAAIQKAGSVSGGLSDFLKANPDATPFTVFQSTDPNGYSLPESNQAQAWINQNLGIIQDPNYSFAAAWLMPQLTDTTYNVAVYNEQLAQGVRQKRTPDQFLQALYIAAGNQQYYGVDQPAYQAALKSGKYDPSQLRSSFSAYTTQYGKQNPIWYDDFTSQDRTSRRQQAIVQLGNLVKSGQAPPGPMTDGIAGLLKDYQSYQDGIAQGIGTKAQMADAFEQYLVSVAQGNPALKPFILSVLGPLVSTTGASFTAAATNAGLA